MDQPTCISNELNSLELQEEIKLYMTTYAFLRCVIRMVDSKAVTSSSRSSRSASSAFFSSAAALSFGSVALS